MNIPKHVAIIMDGNGRWAKQRFLPRVAGHKQGAESVRSIVSECSKKGISFLTLFAFSSENWKRPKDEVDFLLNLFLRSLHNESETLHKNNIRLTILGDKTAFAPELQEAMRASEALMAKNTGLQVNLAVNYGGRWDIVQAARLMASKLLKGQIKLEEFDERLFQAHTSLAKCPPPDLLIRTSGEHRLSNFLLWDLAYTELYFTETHWPDFREAEFEKALQDFAARQRRFGYAFEATEKSRDSIEVDLHA